MVDFHVTSDNGSGDSIEPVAKAIEAEGFTVETSPSSPNAEALRNQGTVKPPTKLVFICNGGIAGQTYGSFALDFQEGMCFTIFAFDNYATHFSTTTEDALRTMPLVSEGDSGGFATQEAADDFAGHTTCSYQEKYPNVFAFIADETSAESLGKRIAHGDYTCGGSGGETTTGSGGGAQIKDKTFEKCIRRICAATDSVFLVESNAAVLFPYVDWMAFTLRQKINTIKSNEIDPNVFTMEYGNEGFYNKVSIAWGGATLPERYPKDEEGNPIETKKVTNYTSKDILDNMRLTNFNYDTWLAKQEAAANEDTSNNEITTDTNGTTKIKNKKAKTTQEIIEDENGNLMLSEQYDSLVDIYGEMEKRVESAAPDFETAQYIVNALLIQYVRDYNNSCKCRALNVRKYIGGTFYSVENPFTKESELFYLNSYTMRTQKGAPMYHDLDFKYGPEGAEELLDYQTYGGGGGGGTATNSTGSATEDEVWKRAEVPCHQWSCGELRESESDTQDPQVAEDYYNKKAPSGKFCFSCYGMSAFLYYEFNYKAGIACQVVGNSGHHVVMLDRNDGQGFVKTVEEYRQHCDQGFRWDTSTPTTVLLAAPSGGSSSGGNTASNNNNGGNRS